MFGISSLINLFRRSAAPSAYAPAAGSKTEASPVPAILGIWKVGEPLHQSGGCVLHAAGPADGSGWPRMRHVIKTTAAIGSDAPPSSVRAIRAAFDAAVVRHPSLISVVDGSVDSARPYVVFDRLAGRTWASQLKSTTIGGCLFWSRQVAAALAAMHEGGWIHGDVRPQNVWICPDGSAKLIDLSQATPIHCPLRPGQIHRRDQTAPELLAGRTAATDAVDVFALGRTMADAMSVIQSPAGGLVESIGELVERMTSTEPGDRPTAAASGDELATLELRLLGSTIRPMAA